ncbi:PAS [Geofilum rubicundum JCM 15548]|uniref:histidine kinase n=2 Tax=Geofilum TaxID=1236988 RepID=A0A0E9LTK5_9BACT|nr:PAS [Geofilum rubicundum JCM 15548]
MDYTATPLLTVWSEVYVNKKSEINGILDLEGKTIAVMKSDFNGKYLKQLTEKLAITCVFIETTDFEEVFKLISGNKVNAGVVNNTFGAPKSAEYELLSSGIIFNPFDIYFTVKKGANQELLTILNKYLHDWKHDRNSVYNTARQKWSQGHVGAIEVFPEWLESTIYLVLLVVLTLFTFIGLLRYKIRAATKKIKYSELIFKTFMENTPAYVYIKDEHLNHLYRNRMVDKVNGVGPNDKVSSAKTVFEPHIAELVERMDKEILSSKKKQCDLQYFCKLNGKNTWLHDYKFYLNLPNGKPAIAGLSFDITKLKNTESELIKAKERAEESDHLKSAFLANMSHEIRTPMNGILGFANLLKNPDLSGEQQQKYIEIINKSGIRMLNIINDIIDISKIESGLMKVDIRDVNINEQIEFIDSFFKAEAEAKGLSFSYKSPLPAEKAIIKTDGEKVYAILTNLVKNAIKYTADGSIELGYKFVEKDKSLQFHIKDTGIGIPKNRQKAIFDRFIQLTFLIKRPTREQV